ncbi:hypothetical protein SAMN06298216_3123 [Spirosomataceae bacterium TFI 002]|nr:hypothetical protein SAMN06298216_3123 [Spirosomataceae bacterium TFI 002]
MKKIQIMAILVLASLSAFSQETSGYFYGQDLFKFSQYGNLGSARVQGMGGAFVALGADASSAIINPAGLGFYNRNEFSLSPVINSLSTSSDYLRQNTPFTASNIGIGQAALVFSKNGVGTRRKKKTFGISYNTLVSFRNEFEYNGLNNVSSIQDHFAEEANFRGVGTEVLDREFNANTGVADTPEALYYQAFMIEPTNDGYVVFEPSFPVDQQGRVSENGNLGQISLSFANNFDDRTYVGLTVGIQNLNYNSVDYIDEVFPNAEYLSGLRSTNELSSQGTGINLALGGIFRATESLNLGVSLTSPTIMRTRETFISTIAISPNGNAVQTNFPTVRTLPNDFSYRFTSPFRANAGAAYFLPNKLGVLSAEVDYVAYGNMGIVDPENSVWTNEQKSAINRVYKNTVNVKVGGEARLGIGRLRAGFNRMGDPLVVADGVKRNLNTVTFGGGVRVNRFFADVSVNYQSTQSSFTPYVLVNETDYSSVLIDSKRTIVGLSVGTFF